MPHNTPRTKIFTVVFYLKNPVFTCQHSVTSVSSNHKNVFKVLSSLVAECGI